jgi:hypothetical protein
VSILVRRRHVTAPAERLPLLRNWACVAALAVSERDLVIDTSAADHPTVRSVEMSDR